jgi:hypothetical protein
MKLHEIAAIPAPSPRGHQKIIKWLYGLHIQKYTIRLDGVVDVNGDVDLYGFQGKTLPIRFGNVSGFFNCSSSNLTSLIGSHQSVGGYFTCFQTKVSSLEGAPQYVGGNFFCNSTKILSLHNIHKQVKHIGGYFNCTATGNVTHLLGLLLIDGPTEFDVERGLINDILNKYVGTGDILSAQDELIDAGFIDQARL